MHIATRSTTRAIATVMLLGGMAVPAAADQPGSVPGAVDLFYGDFEQGILLFAGQQPEDFCTGDTLTPTALRAVQRGDGSTVLLGSDREVPIYLYAASVGAPELIGQTCDAMFDDDPGTVPPAPIATGSGSTVQRITIETDGTQHVKNQTVGTAWSEAGVRWIVRGWADLTVVDGMPVGDPADFQGLRARTAPRMS